MPKNLIFLAPNLLRYIFDSVFCGKVKLKLLNKSLENDPNSFHLLYDFLDILAFNKIFMIDFFSKFLIILGQISDSTNIAILGFQ